MAETGKRPFNVGDLIHVIQVLVLIASMGIAYEKFNEATVQVELLNQKMTRVEHYLSSKDPGYWKASKEIE